MNFSVKIDPETKQRHMATSSRNGELLLHPFTNKGAAYSIEERTELGLHGLIPAAISTIEEQLVRSYENYQATPTNLGKFIYLSSLQDRNETLFYRLVHEHIDEMMPIVYTPVVGEACQKFSHIYRRARGLYISYNQRHRMTETLANYGAPHPSVIVVTDGERILGLGDQGAGGMGICIGKLVLYTLCAGRVAVHHDSHLPRRGNRQRGAAQGPAVPRPDGRSGSAARPYQDFIDSFVAAVKEVFPQRALPVGGLPQGERPAAAQALPRRAVHVQRRHPGDGAVTLAGLYAAMRITGQRLRDQRIVNAGAGASAQGISDLCVSALIEDGLTEAEAKRRIWTVDSHGLVTDGASRTWRTSSARTRGRWRRSPSSSAATARPSRSRRRWRTPSRRS